jgi:quercetin dioxygenase-like cupin family protein
MRALAAIALAACSQPAPAPTKPTSDPMGSAAVPVDAPPISQEEKLAAIQKAMNELDELAQGCWAAAATDRFDIEGDLALMVEITATSAKATVITDTARNVKLADCVVQLLGAYRWAPPLHGDTIKLPFRFRAPDGQSVIDRQLVEWHGQQNVSVAVLLDENNTGNAAASMLEVAIAPRAGTGMRVADRAELWYFLGEAEVKYPVKASTKVGGIEGTLSSMAKAGSMMFVPAGSAREVIARLPDMHAVVLVVPGGREGSARAGALPTASKRASTANVTMLETGKTYGPATLFLDASIVKGTPLAASILTLGANAKVAEHVHAKETELLYVLDGSGTMTIDGQDVAVTPTSVIQIPPNTKHAFAATSAVRAVQIYTPPGPEQRFKKP